MPAKHLLMEDMAQSLAKVIIHVVFSTKSRLPFLKAQYRKQLFAYMTTVAEDNKCEVYEINGIEDHVHMLCRLPRTITLAKLVEALKRTSSKWLKMQGSDLEYFAWQNGYSVFSVSPTNIEPVRKYIQNQEQHHQKAPFQSELLAFLKGSDTKYDPEYLWD